MLGETRYSLIERLNAEPDYKYPDPGNLEHLLADVASLGYCKAVGEGVTHIDWSEIYSWSRVMRNSLTPFEAEALHRLSCEYVQQYAKANGQPCAMPAEEMTRDRRKFVAEKAMELIEMLRKPDD